MKLSIFEFAVNRSKAVDKLTAIQDLIRDHMLCIYYWRDQEPANHWKQEVAAFLGQIPRIKGNYKLKYDVVYQELYGYISDILYERIEAFVDGIYYKEDYKMPEIENYDTECLKLFMDSFYDFVATKLSKDGYILKSEVYSKINELLGGNNEAVC